MPDTRACQRPAVPGLPPVRPLAIILCEYQHARVHAALSLACAAAALGRGVSVFASGVSVTALRRDACWHEDVAIKAVGGATLPELIRSAHELGVAFTACETGMHLARMRSDFLADFVTTGGLLGFLRSSPDAEIVSF